MSMRYPGGLIASTPVTAAYPSGVWTQAQTIPYASTNVWMRDQYWPYTTLLLQGNGTNGAQNNTFLDSSTNNFTITRNGNTTQGSFTPYEANGYWSNYFGGSSYVNAASSTAFGLGTGNFTIEVWVFPTSNPANGPGTIFDLRTGATASAIVSRIDSSLGLRVYNGPADIEVTLGTVSINVWSHIAIVRSGTTVTTYINGVAGGSATMSSDFGSNQPCYIGVNQTAGYNFNGYMSNFRMLKGTALYTSNFTPSTAPLTAITNTSLLTCQSNRFLDNSTNAFAITVNGSPSVQAFQPFPGATTWSGAVLGGSGYFDGSGDYLTLPTSQTPLALGSSDFTIEAWIYRVSGSGTAVIFIGQSDYATVTGSTYHLYINSVQTSDVYIGSSGYGVTSPNPGLGQWAHIAMVRTGGTLSTYLNGSRVGTRSDLGSGAINTGSTTYVPSIGALATASNPLTGYISNLRIIKGSGGYDATQSTITIPTAPLIAITNTSLLLNFTNAGIFDAAAMNDLETVGNAQVSTSVVKYGTGSMAFDGSGDYLQAPNTVNANFGSGDFAVEFWMYASAQGLAPIVHQTSYASSLGWIVWNYDGVNVATATRKLTFMANGATFVLTTSSDAYVDNTWTHIAVVKNGAGSNNIKIYSNGTAIATGTYATALSNATQPLMVGGIISGVSWNGTAYYNGYIDDLRITKGAARYISNFTPPIARMPQQ